MNSTIRNILRSALCVTALAYCAATQAQKLPNLDGDWIERFTNDTGKAREVNIALANGKGTYHYLARNSSDPCQDKEAPVSVSNQTAEGFDIDVHMSVALAGCEDFSLHPRLAETGIYTGTNQYDHKYTLSRKN